MVKVKGPLFSLEAHGTLDDTLTYESGKYGYYVKANNFPTYSRSPAQGVIRDTFNWCISIWHALPSETKQYWHDHEDYQGLIGYASFMSYMLKRTYLAVFQYESPPNFGFCITGNHIVGEFFTGGGYLVPGT